jgi:hypothetical protein
MLLLSGLKVTQETDCSIGIDSFIPTAMRANVSITRFVRPCSP